MGGDDRGVQDFMHVPIFVIHNADVRKTHHNIASSILQLK